MVGDAHTAAQHGTVTNPDRAGNTPECGDDHRAAEDHIMGDLTKIIDLGPFTDDRVVKNAPVDAGIRTYGDVVLKNDPAKMRRVFYTRRTSHDTEACLPDPGPGEERHMITQKGTVHTGVGADCAVPANLHTGPDYSVGANDSPFTNGGIFSNYRTGSDFRIRMDTRAFRDRAIAESREVARAEQGKRNRAMSVSGKPGNKYRDTRRRGLSRRLANDENRKIRT